MHTNTRNAPGRDLAPIDWKAPPAHMVEPLQNAIQARHGVIFDTDIGHTIKLGGQSLGECLGLS